MQKPGNNANWGCSNRHASGSLGKLLFDINDARYDKHGKPRANFKPQASCLG
jgi:hypothetical protein